MLLILRHTNRANSIGKPGRPGAPGNGRAVKKGGPERSHGRRRRFHHGSIPNLPPGCQPQIVDSLRDARDPFSREVAQELAELEGTDAPFDPDDPIERELADLEGRTADFEPSTDSREEV